jgi:hypothetical protein
MPRLTVTSATALAKSNVQDVYATKASAYKRADKEQAWAEQAGLENLYVDVFKVEGGFLVVWVNTAEVEDNIADDTCGNVDCGGPQEHSSLSEAPVFQPRSTSPVQKEIALARRQYAQQVAEDVDATWVELETWQQNRFPDALRSFPVRAVFDSGSRWSGEVFALDARAAQRAADARLNDLGWDGERRTVSVGQPQPVLRRSLSGRSVWTRSSSSR